MKIRIYTKKEARTQKIVKIKATKDKETFEKPQWDKSSAVVLKERMSMTEEYAEQLNKGFEGSGVYYIINEAEDTKWQEAKTAKEAEKKESEKE
jgi:hypothetical protein